MMVCVIAVSRKKLMQGLLWLISNWFHGSQCHMAVAVWAVLLLRPGVILLLLISHRRKIAAAKVVNVAVS